MADADGGRGSNRGLEVLRGCAALLVVVGHTRFHLLTALGLPTSGTGPLQHLLLAPTLVAKEAVAVFFVLSGYLVGGQVIRQVLENRFSWREYLGKRLSRLWTVLVPGLVLTLVVDRVDLHFFSGTLLRLQDTVDLDAWTAICNGLLLQESRCSSFGSNESLWSLGYEFWFYVLFAGLAVVALARRSLSAVVLAAVVVLACVGLFGPQLVWFFPAWLLGAAVAALQRRWMVRGVPSRLPVGNRALLVWTVVLVAAMVMANRTVEDDPLRFVVVGLPSAPMVLLLALRERLPSPGPVEPLARVGNWLGERSFSVYVFHLPLVKLAVGAAAAMSPWGPWAGLAGTYVLAAAAVTACAGFYWLPERHTPWVRRRMLVLLGVRRRPRSPEERGGVDAEAGPAGPQA